jgi:arylsulfatase A-like enzyme
LTDVLADRARHFVQRTAATGQPFFMYLAPYAPHQPATPAPRHLEAFPDVTAPRPPSFNEADVSDKPAWVQNLPRLTAANIAQLDALYRRRLQSMLAVEDLVVTLVEALAAVGQLDHTYIFFTSDNGFHLGQHRQRAGKNSEFEEDVRVPLLVRGPGVPAGALLPHLVVNADFAPTFAELAGAAAADFVDGRSLVPLLGATPPAEWRRAVLLEHDLTGTRAFRGIRTRRFKYIEYINTGERELYDLRNDPCELDNAFGTADPGLVARLAARLEQLATCSGAGCRVADGGP